MSFAKSNHQWQKMSDVQNHPLYLAYDRFLDQYLKMTNDDNTRRKIFLEIMRQKRKLVQIGIFEEDLK